MTTERNAQGVDGLAEVMGLLAANAPGFELNVTKRAAVNYLRSHGEAIRELVEADREYDEACASAPAHGNISYRETLALVPAIARAIRRRAAALAKFPEPRP